MGDESRARVEKAIAEVQALSTVGTKSQLQSIMNVVGESSLTVAEGLESTAAEIRRFNEAIATANTTTSRVSDQLMTLNRRLLVATWVAAVATVLAAAAGLWSAYKAQ